MGIVKDLLVLGIKVICVKMMWRAVHAIITTLQSML